MRNLIAYIALVPCLLAGDSFEPSEGSELRYTQVFFVWPQIPGAASYSIEIISGSDSATTHVQGNSYLSLGYLEWGGSYIWEACGLDDDQSVLACHEQRSFSVDSIPSYFPDSIEIVESNPSLYSSGINVLDFESLNFSLALDMDGAPVWFVDPEDFYGSRILVTGFLESGRFTGFGPGVGYEIDRDGQIIFQSPNGYAIHHDFNRTPMGTYLMVTADTRYHPCPEECPPGLPDLIPWQGDRFVELDSDGNELWSWSTFDGYSLSEYNPIYIESFAGATNFDWTHSNSARYDPVSDAVFISARNLSRVTKIDYGTGEHMWDLGRHDFMDQIYFDEEFNFSQQHSVQLLDSGNMLFFDNHRYLEPELSRCIEISYDDSYSASMVWEHTLPIEMFTGSRGECDRLDNGNTLISAGRTGNVLEVTDDGQTAWHLKVLSNGFDVTVYRTDRVENLYPVAFSLAIDGLDAQGQVTATGEEVTGTVFSSGWGTGQFTLELYSDAALILSEEIALDGAGTGFSIDISGTDHNGQLEIVAYPSGMGYLSRSVSFGIQPSLNGDLNGDGILNILDIVIIVSAITGATELSDQEHALADLNGDGILNVLDIVQLIAEIIGG